MGRRGVKRPGRRARPSGIGVPDPAAVAARGALGERGAPTVAGGYRLVRVLGEGEHAVVHLGHATGGTAANEEPRTAAVKIHREAVSLESVDREIEALGRVVHAHALHLDDLATLPDGRVCLIVERVGGRGLGRLVAQDHEISAGEAVTILTPIVDAVHALHTGGVAHGRIRLSNVLFRDDGAPVLVGFGHATLFPPGSSAASLASNPAVLHDRRQLATLVQSVLDRVPGDAAEALARRVVDEQVQADDFTARLTDALFDLAPPRPVRFVRTGARPVAPRILREAAPVVADRAPTGSQAGVRRLLHNSRPWLLHKTRPWLLQKARPALDRARLVRPRVWLVAGGVLVSLVAATAVLPANESVSGTREETGGTALSSADDDDATPTAPGWPAEPLPPGTATPAPPSDQAPGRETAFDGRAAASDPLVGDDPVAALDALLRERERCVRDLSVLCLDGVLQDGSVAMQHDVDLVRSVQAGGELTADAAIIAQSPVLLERLGDSALVGLGDGAETQPASVLMMRSEAGWRIRNYLFR